MVAIFRVTTKLDKTSGTNWDIVHDPSHPQIRQQVVQLMDKIRGFTIVLDRLEVMFRDERSLLVEKEIRGILSEKEKNGGGSFGGRQSE